MNDTICVSTYNYVSYNNTQTNKTYVKCNNTIEYFHE